MNSRFPVLLPLIGIILLGGCATTPSPDASGAKTAESRPAKDSATRKDPEDTLQQGMSAEAVKAVMGEPAEIRPYPNPSFGKAEVWIYRRRSIGSMQEVQIGTHSTQIMTLAADGTTRIANTMDEPVYKRETTNIIDTISLLMIDGHFIVYKRATEQQKEFD